MDTDKAIAAAMLAFSVYCAWSEITYGSYARSIESRWGQRPIGRSLLRMSATMSITAALFCVGILTVEAAPAVVVIVVGALFLVGMLLSASLFFFSVPRLLIPVQWRSQESLWSYFWGRGGRAHR